uniref:OSJNBa0013A04.6 protein n=1 Tax=Oryza sativa subsp. japonica TaxID=39947 RepID=Q7X8W7_ORYSJ|nr:OSJNBa0042D13.24 [Oryza sativa Japonica Group]CAE05169.2 OSJNBa0013A04.6 [Oryza sativa Japonica Group]
MTGFNLPENFKENPEAFFRSVRPQVVAPQKTLLTKKPAEPVPPTFKSMADKTLREYAAPTTDNVAIGPQINMGDVDFDLKSSLITMAQASPFCSKPNEDANAHLQQFLEIYSTYTIKGVSPDAVRLMLNLLMKRLDDHDKRPQSTVKALDSHVTCEVYGGTGHSGNDCPETREVAMYMGNKNNGYRPQGGLGWNQPRPYYQGGNNNGNFSNQPSLKDLVFAQAKTTDALSKKLASNDKILENINVKLDGFASAFQNQLSFNKIIETQLAQLACLVPANETGRIPWQPDSSIQNVKAITTRGGTNGIAREAPSNDSADKESRKQSVDEQFAHFVEVIQKIHISVPLFDAMHVPTYARYLKDIVNNKRLLPTTEVVKLTEQCSNVILHNLPEKKKDSGCPMITCSIDQALCDLGASVSVMPKDVFVTS